MRFNTRIITTIDDVPVDHVPCKYFYRHFDGVLPATFQKMLSDAHMNGHVRAVKLVRTIGELKTGRVFLHKEDTMRFLESQLSKKAEEQRPAATDTHVVSATWQDNSELLAAIRGLTKAVKDLTAATELKSEAVCEEACQAGGFAS
jgi:hypothetical protein